MSDAGRLESLRFHWGSAYRIEHVGSFWMAERREGPWRPALVAWTATQLRELIRADYDSHTVKARATPGPE